MGKIKKTLGTIGLWILLQIVAIVPYLIVANIRDIDYMDLMAPAMLVADLAVILVLWIIRYYKMKELGERVPLIVLLLALVLGFASFTAIDILAIPFQLSDNMAPFFNAMVKSFWGFLAIAIVGPVMEEIMMRRIILNEIAQATGKKWWGILISALLFSLIHGNPIQIFFALPAGILLGWLYCKTGRLIVPICVHIMNNTFSFFAMRAGEQSETNFTDLWTQVALYACLAAAVALIIWFNVYYSRHEINTDLPYEYEDKSVKVETEPAEEPAAPEPVEVTEQ